MKEDNSIEIICCVALDDIKVHHHLMPISRHPSISKIWVIRSAKQLYKPVPKVEYIVIPDKIRLIRFLKMLLKSIKMGRRKEVKGFISFNPLPYGLIALIAAKLNHKPIHLGFIGLDWNIDCQRPGVSFFKQIFKRADFITVTGPLMKKEMVHAKFDENKIFVLPHSVDLEHFSNNDSNKRKYTSIYVGRLVPLKNVDIILEAFKLVLQKKSEHSFCIVGDGPLRDQLEQSLQGFQHSDKIEFTGHVDDVQPYLRDALSLIIASTHEGFPFSMVEAICSGVIPVSTPVGTIPDKLTDQINVLFFPIGGAEKLAENIISLIEDKALVENLRKNLFSLRRSFSFNLATQVWDPWLKNLSYS